MKPAMCQALSFSSMAASRKSKLKLRQRSPRSSRKWNGWMSTTPDGTPLLLRDLEVEEIYALDVNLP